MPLYPQADVSSRAEDFLNRRRSEQTLNTLRRQSLSEALDDLGSLPRLGSRALTLTLTDAVEGASQRRTRLPAGWRMSESVCSFDGGPELADRGRDDDDRRPGTRHRRP